VRGRVRQRPWSGERVGSSGEWVGPGGARVDMSGEHVGLVAAFTVVLGEYPIVSIPCRECQQVSRDRAPRRQLAMAGTGATRRIGDSQGL
jgi:hypothetical protein